MAHTSLRLFYSAVDSFSKFKFLFHLLDPLLPFYQLTLKPQKFSFPLLVFLPLFVVPFLSLLPLEGQPAHKLFGLLVLRGLRVIVEKLLRFKDRTTQGLIRRKSQQSDFRFNEAKLNPQVLGQVL